MHNRPTILHLIHHLDLGGAEVMLANMLPHLAGLGYDVQAASLRGGGPAAERLMQRGIPVHCIEKRRGPDPAALCRLHLLLRRLQPAILNTHAFSAGLWGRLAAVFARVPIVVVTEHTPAGWHRPRKHCVVNTLLRPRTSHYVAVCAQVADSLTAREGVPPERLSVIPNGICPGPVQRRPDRRTCRQRLSLPGERPIVGMVARCSPEKGGDLLLRAVAHLAQSGRELHAVLVGDGPALPAWQSLARECAVTERVTFAGRQLDVAPWFAAFTVLACPSRQEGLSLTALEAQAAGVPVVAACVGGFPDLIEHDRTGLLVPPGDAAALAEALWRIAVSPELARRLADAGRRKVLNRYHVEQTARLYADLYERLLSQGCRTNRRNVA